MNRFQNISKLVVLTLLTVLIIIIKDLNLEVNLQSLGVSYI